MPSSLSPPAPIRQHIERAVKRGVKEAENADSGEHTVSSASTSHGAEGQEGKDRQDRYVQAHASIWRMKSACARQKRTQGRRATVTG
jgi:hypothetical protein